MQKNRRRGMPASSNFSHLINLSRSQGQENTDAWKIPFCSFGTRPHAGFLHSRHRPASSPRGDARSLPTHLNADFVRNKYTGDEVIRVRILKPTSSITLNALEIEFEQANITSDHETMNA